MRLLTTLLLICSTMFVQAQNVESDNNATDAKTTAAISAVASEIEKAEAVNVFIDYDDEFNQPEKMAVSVKQKRQSDEFIDTDHVTKLLIAFLINFIAIMIVVRWLYYPKC